MFEPRSRSVDPALLMESLFKLTELESRVPLNMNVLVGGRVPKVIGLAEALTEWLGHRRDVLLRRSRYRLSQIEHRLEVLGGYLVAYLNLDKVIKIIRTEDEPKPVLMKTFKLSDVQAEAILNMRLRNLRKLEEMEIREEDKKLRAEKKSIEELLRSEKSQWKTIAGEIREVREKFGPKTPLGKRRTTFADAPAHDEAAIEEALVEREPITVVVSEKGWIRGLRGHVADLSSLAFKTDDALKLAFFAETTSKLLVFATNGRCYTIEAAKLPGGRGHGEPIRLFIELEQEGDIVSVFRHEGGRKFIVASKQGRGFIVAEDECVANTRKGKQILNVKPPDEGRAIAVADGELVAAIGENRKMLVFPIDQVPEMARGRGVRLQRHKDGGLSDIQVFEAVKGLSWTDSAGRVFTLTLKELADWRGNRADAGRLAPKGFPKNNKFGSASGRAASNGKNGGEFSAGRCLFWRGEGRAVGHARRTAGGLGPLKAVAVGHLDCGQRMFVQHRVVGNDLVHVEDVSRDGVNLIRAQRLRRVQRHGAVDVVVKRRGVRPIASDRHDRLFGRKRSGAAGEPIHRSFGAVLAVTRRASVGENLPALRHRAAAVGQIGAVRRDVDVPGFDEVFGWRLSETEPLLCVRRLGGFLRLGCRDRRKCRQQTGEQQDDGEATRRRHKGSSLCRPRRSSTARWRCSDSETAHLARRAALRASAGRIRFRRWRGWR